MVHTFFSTVSFILALASLTLAPALFTAEYKKLPRDLAPATALVVTGESEQGFNLYFTLGYAM